MFLEYEEEVNFLDMFLFCLKFEGKMQKCGQSKEINQCLVKFNWIEVIKNSGIDSLQF